MNLTYRSAALYDKAPRASGKPDQVSAATLPDGMTVKAPTRDISGHRFGMLTATFVVGKNKSNSLVWRCSCDCGVSVDRSSASLQKAKGVSSCGCYLKRVSKEHLASKTPWNKGQTYQTKSADSEYANKKAWSTAVLRIKGNSCERCGWSEARCDVHHIIPKSAGGKNIVSNGRVLCPNHHRVMHESTLLVAA